MRFWPFADLTPGDGVRNMLAKTLELTETDPAILACNVPPGGNGARVMN
jgi:hypothetical protein